MTHHQFGNLVDFGFEDPSGGGSHGMLELKGALYVNEQSTMPTAIAIGTNEAVGVTNGSTEGELLVLALSGSVMGTEDTLGVSCVIPWMDVGRLVADLIDSAKRAGGNHALNDFEVGLSEEIARLELDRNDRPSPNGL